MTTKFSSILNDITDLYVPEEDLENKIAQLSLKVVLISAAIVTVLVIIAWLLNNKKPKLKLPLFIGIAGTMALSTLMLIFSTVYLNVNSDSGGPVHWHADMEVWACGNELELRNPTGFSNKIGTSTLHEHNDHRIHLEGVVVDEQIDASLGKFMYVIGGAITDDALVVPVNPASGEYFEDEVDGDGPSNRYAQQINDNFIPGDEKGNFAKFIDGQKCGEQEAEVQVFVYKYNEEDDTYEQTKLTRPQDYVITDDPNVPPGDCIIVEFGPAKSKTDKLCEQYGVRDIDRCETYGVEADEKSICTMKQINYNMNANYYEEPANQQGDDI
jgi:hypothetical protein